ncbi:hypothetical protein LEN26_015938 [Aphanomyces euteiches]|nr:hypothetical protein LEN26_015938 [Aphanomyces euteiches]
MDLPAASKFGQKLAHTEKHVRDKAVKSLTLYLVKKKEWSDLDLDKIWKALFYCIWMSDKPKIQNELAENLSQLVHAFPSAELKMRFLHSFFKTIHREWHGIDGLRLDKFYSLIRKMLYQSFQFLQTSWDQAEVFSTHLSGEILSKLPNGLRLHLCDVYLPELHKSIGETIPGENLVMLLEPFFTLISSETDKIVTKRVNDMVFQPMLKDFQFQDTLQEDNTTDSEDVEENVAKVFGAAKLADIQHRIFELAAAAETLDRNRNILYSIYSAFYAVTKVDSAKQEKKRPAEDDGKNKKKRRKQTKADNAEDGTPLEPVEEVKSPPKTKKQEEPGKKAKSGKKDAAPVVKEAAKEETGKKKATKADTPSTKVEKEESPKKGKKNKKVTEETPAKEEEAQAEVAPKKKSAKATKAPATQKEMATPYPRCTSCGGFGKGLVPKNKSMCGHCERQTKQTAKVQAAEKKRKAEVQAEEAASEAKEAKKVRFGTNKALPYELSMKRMKKSVDKDLVKPASGKGLLKVKEVIATATNNVKKNTTLNVKRARAADFF